MRKKILVMIPAGEVYDHDCVRWYQAHDIQRNIEHYHNIGDAFVYDSSLKLLDFEFLDVAKIADPTPADIDRYNAEFDYVFLRGSNYIHGTMRWQRTVELLEKLKIPVIAFGFGAQAPKCGPLVLSDETKLVLRMMADRCVSLGVRGAYTADVLWDLGIKNVRIIGCPTAFRRRDPDLRIDLPPLETVRNIGITLRREVSPTYAQNIQMYLTRHRDLVREMAGRFDVTLMAQGEIEEKKMVLGTPEQKREGLEALKANAWAKQWYLDETMERLHQTRLFYSDVVADYETLVRTKDMVLGYRLHGNLMALSNGVPSVYFTYDSRTAEFAETFGIPSYNVFSDKKFVLEDYWDQSLFEKFNQAYHSRYREMRAFLDENGVPHRLPATSAAPAAIRRAA